MAKKVLVTYASCTGFTQGVAEMIGKTIEDNHLVVDVIPMKDVKNLENYDAVVAGSGIQAGTWLPEATKFVRENRSELSKKPFAAFLVCMTLAMKNGENCRSHVQTWLQPVKSLVPTVSAEVFAGGLDLKKIPSASDRLKFRLSTLFGIWKAGDHRDWGVIRLWAGELKSKLA
ncbi:MAG: flavodoxin domain-containing protein [Anaerolineaceae bacterium]|nr:flavodoxin domain-containing protein [Anaerolineaceae bacterium]